MFYVSIRNIFSIKSHYNSFYIWTELEIIASCLIYDSRLSIINIDLDISSLIHRPFFLYLFSDNLSGRKEISKSRSSLGSPFKSKPVSETTVWNLLKFGADIVFHIINKYILLEHKNCVKSQKSFKSEILMVRILNMIWVCLIIMI